MNGDTTMPTALAGQATAHPFPQGAISIGLAVIALTVAAILHWKKKAPKTCGLLALAAGVGISGGLLGHFVTKAVTWISGLVGDLTTQMFGAAVPAVLAVGALIVFIHDLWPGHKTGRMTPVLGLLLPTLAASVGGAAGSLTGSAIHMISAAIASALTTLFGSH
jgi:hypothetical protein